MKVLLEGIEMTRTGLLSSLEKFGLQQLQSKGEAFDPNFHEALTMEANCEIPANHVIQEFQKGYHVQGPAAQSCQSHCFLRRNEIASHSSKYILVTIRRNYHE